MIHSFDFASNKFKDTAVVVGVRSSIIHLTGFKSVCVGEVLTSADKIHALVMSLSDEQVTAVVFSENPVPIGTVMARTGEQLHVSVGKEIKGSVIDALGYTISGNKDLSQDSQPRPVFTSAVPISGRAHITNFFETGTSLVDLMVPIGAGQRELVLGDRGSGKTFFVLRTIVNQAKSGRVVIIALIAKRQAEIKKIISYLKKAGVFEQCVLVVSQAQSSLGEIYLTPYTAMAVAEHFRDLGEDSLVVLDDLTNHASFYRELALLMGEFPGRDSYPGEIFYLHSSLLERGGNFTLQNGKTASITCLPVAESSDGEINGYIQTNLMSMTDGHLFFDQKLFYRGQRPAINVFLSVTRIGRQTQSALMRDISNQIMELFQEAEHLQSFSRFGAEITDRAKNTMLKVEHLWQFFQQSQLNSLAFPIQILGLTLAWHGKTSLLSERSLQKFLQNKKFIKRIENEMQDCQSFANFITKTKSLLSKLEAYAIES